MNRLLLLTCFFSPFLCSSQNNGLCIQVIASTGGSGAQGNYNVSWTVGETVVSTLSGTSHKVTQGFHQPDVCAPVSTSNLNLEALGIDVFPNPTTAYFSIRYTATEKSSLSVKAFDVLGKEVLAPTPLDTPSGTILDTAIWPTGLYFLQITDNLSKATATIRVVRM